VGRQRANAETEHAGAEAAAPREPQDERSEWWGDGQDGGPDPRMRGERGERHGWGPDPRVSGNKSVGDRGAASRAERLSRLIASAVASPESGCVHYADIVVHDAVVVDRLLSSSRRSSLALLPRDFMTVV
jgi:hypothetical protein